MTEFSDSLADHIVLGAVAIMSRSRRVMADSEILRREAAALREEAQELCDRAAEERATAEAARRKRRDRAG